MKRDDLLENVRLLGVPLMEVEKAVDADATLAELVRSREMRFWEIFPVALANSANKGMFEYQEVEKKLSREERRVFQELLLASLALYRALGLAFPWGKTLFLRHLPYSKKELEERAEQFRKNEPVSIGGREIYPERLVSIFRQYYSPAESDDLKNLISRKEELGLEFALSQVFSPRQKELFLKKLRGERFTKSEREYYSRTVKKKVQALANEKLHQLAKSV